MGESSAWAADGTDHILAPLDAASTPEGPRVIFPHCPLRLDEVLRDGDVPPGAVVTAAVSALRGAREAERLGADRGCWWVTTEGRPVLALTGSLPWREDTVALLRSLAPEDPALERAVEAAAQALTDPKRLRREAESIEAALFTAADAGPLPTERRDGVAAPTRRMRDTTPRASGDGVGGTLRDLVARLVDLGVAERMGAAWRSVVRAGRTPSRPRNRRRVFVVAAAAAVAVIVIGALWPAGDGEGSAAVARGTAMATSGAQTPPPSPDPVPGDVREADEGSADIVAAARELVDALRSCPDTACAESLWEDPASTDTVAAAADDYVVEVVDEYGGAAAVRIVGRSATQVLVMVRVEKRWLVREVYDLADQP